MRSIAKAFAVPAATVHRWFEEGVFVKAQKDRIGWICSRKSALAWLRVYAPEREAAGALALPEAHYGPDPDPDDIDSPQLAPHPDRGLRHFDVYGLSTAQLEQLWKAQGGACAMCKAAGTMTKNGMVGLVIDHDHVTGEARGLLCSTCNTLEGAYEAARERGVVEYLRNPPAKRLKIYAIHKDLHE